MRPNAYARDRAQTHSRFSNDAPVYNDQLQNLDMELKILERQREIIKQKQQSQMMSQSQNVYNQPSSSYGHAESKNANAYQRKGKRPFEGSWQNQSSAKQARINPWETLYDNPQPLMKIQTNHYNKSNFTNIKPKPRTDFKSNAIRMKDFVPKKYAISNVRKTSDNSASNIDKKYLSKEILRPFVEPSPSMKGRLEFALGHITKQLRQSKKVDEQTLQKFKMPTALRAVKNIIRQRISDVMMNKVVGTAFDILDHYRKKYPNDVDEGIIQAINSPPKPYENMTVFVKPIPIKESEKIKKFFMSKMNKLLKNKVTEMINKLSIIYDNESDILKCLEDLPDIEDIDEEDISECNENKDKAEKDIIKSDNANEVSLEIDKADENKDGIESPLTDANKDDIENDKADVNKDSMEVDNADANNDSIESDKTDANEDNTEGEDVSKDANVNDNSEIEEKCANEAITNDDEIKESNVETAEEKPVKNKKIEQYYKLMDLLIGKRLPVLMENFKEDFVNLLSSDKDFMTAKQNVIAELKIQLKAAYADAAKESPKAVSTENKLGKETSPQSKLAEIQAGKEDELAENKLAKEKDDKKEPANGTGLQKSGQLCVMLLGRPSLPPKPVIYEFLNKYKPQSIKKHKTVSNLLVISFNNEEDYNNILAANESKVGEATFIIKSNEVIAAEKQNEPTITNKEISATYETKVISEETNQDSKENKTNEEDVIEDKKDTSNQDVTESCETKNEDNKENEENVMEISEANDDDVKEIVTKDQVIIDITEDSQDNDSKKASGSKTKDMETIEETAENDVVVVEKAVVGNANVVKEAAVGTPTRSSSRLANTVPSTIKTRRASRLAQ